MPQFIFGNSYDSVANRDLQYDQNRDSRFFNSLAATRAAQQQLDDAAARAAGMQIQQQQAAQEMAFRQQQSQQSAAQNAALFQFERQKFGIDTGLRARQLDIAADKTDPYQFKFEQEQRRGMQEDKDMGALTGQYADLLNKRKQVDTALGNLGTATTVYDKLHNPWLWFGKGKTEAEKAAVDQLGLKQVFDQYLPKDAADYSLAEKITFVHPKLQSQKDELDVQLRQLESAGTGKWVKQTEDGRWVPNFQPRYGAAPTAEVAPTVRPRTGATASWDLTPQTASGFSSLFSGMRGSPPGPAVAPQEAAPMAPPVSASMGGRVDPARAKIINYAIASWQREPAKRDAIIAQAAKLGVDVSYYLR